jgi:hypothetical protein
MKDIQINGGIKCGNNTFKNLNLIEPNLVPEDISPITCLKFDTLMTGEDLIRSKYKMNITEFNFVVGFITSFYPKVSMNVIQDKLLTSSSFPIKLCVLAISNNLQDITRYKLETTKVQLSDSEMDEFRFEQLKKIISNMEQYL